MNYIKGDIENKIIGIYFFITDFTNFIRSQNLQLHGSKKRGIKAKITDEEIATIGIVRCLLGIDCIKSFYTIAYPTLKELFPGLPKYKGFIKALNRTTYLQMLILQILLCLSKQNTNSKIFFVDATPYPVCNNKRIFTHKTFKDIAQRGKSSMGWFYGFKLHIVTDQNKHILGLKVTSGEVNERKPIKELLNSLKGTAIMDSAYLSADLADEFIQKGLHYFANVRKTMKKLMSKEQHQFLKLRQSIETTYGLLKQRFALVSTLTRSFLGFISRICCSFLAYILNFQT